MKKSKLQQMFREDVKSGFDKTILGATEEAHQFIERGDRKSLEMYDNLFYTLKADYGEELLDEFNLLKPIQKYYEARNDMPL